ncbi:MAG: hypothetical protein U5O69_01215 [Candidatus Competibacteraceae bacterium]|nr:hypothetical protein [Candidatus Competibacteraceae bacterium]
MGIGQDRRGQVGNGQRLPRRDPRRVQRPQPQVDTGDFQQGAKPSPGIGVDREGLQQGDFLPRVIAERRHLERLTRRVRHLAPLVAVAHEGGVAGRAQRRVGPFRLQRRLAARFQLRP